MVLKMRRTFLSVIKDCHNDREWTDVNIQHNGSVTPCHKFVLGTTSPVLQDVFLKSETGVEAESLIFDGSFEEAEIAEFLSYAYGVSNALPENFLFLCPSHFQVKPDIIKPEPSESSLHRNNNQSHNHSIWDAEDWTADRQQDRTQSYENDYDNYYEEGGTNYDTDEFINDDDEYDEKPRKKRKYTKRSSSEKGEKKSKSFPKQCPHCPKQLTCNWHYERHLKTHDEQREKKAKTPKVEAEEFGSFVCVQCGEEFPTKKALKTHEYKHKNELSCEFKDCNEIFLSYLAYSNHMLYIHKKVIKRRKCHAKVKSGADDEERKKKDQEEKKHLCTECGRGFREADSLKKHVIFVHTERAIPTCICNVCGKKFKTNNKLKNHMLLHEPPTLPCPFCDKLFETDHKVKKHIKSTHVEDDQKLYQCTFCQKGFSHFPSYESHMNSHKNLRPYQCHLCDNAYQNHFNLQQHVKKNHGVLISSNHNA